MRRGPRWLRIAVSKAKYPRCLVQRHKSWERESMLMALGSGKSKRCPTCNRLVLKKQFRGGGVHEGLRRA